VKEKELRFALVCYGGVSLAVYMHGVTKEILKLVRASREYHAFASTTSRGRTYDDVAAKRGDQVDTERVYFELLRAIGKTLDLRVVVDIIAGASAGGINGIILARALAHDLDIDPLRNFWLKYCDVTELMPPHVKAGPWRKWYFRPFVWSFLWRYRADLGDNLELKRKLSMFLRSRWFKPPFDGYNLTRVLYDGFAAMGKPAAPGVSLVPAGLELDLFVTVTDFYGYVTDTPIHDPPLIRDREHRQVMRFSYRHWPKGHEESSLDMEGLPALAFAARSTSSFPGAFPPTQFAEIDRLIAERNLGWHTRVDFLYRNFRPYLVANLNPSDAAFIDGSVLNNKPFAQAIAAIGGRPAFRQVDRRLLYIDPHPRGAESLNWGRVPGWFETFKGALSDIPRNEPIHDDLSWVNAYNNEVRRLQTVIDSARKHIRDIATRIAGDALNGPLTGPEVGRYRDMANNRARAETGFAYEGYLRLKLTAVLEDVAALVAEICGHVRDSVEALRIAAVIQAWANQCGVSPSARDLMTTVETPLPGVDRPPPRWVKFLLRFDVRYRQRRVRFVVRAVNELYTRLAEPAFAGVGSDQLDTIKAGLYDLLGLLRPMAGRHAVSTALPDSEGAERGTFRHETVAAIKAVIRDVIGSPDAPEAAAQRFTDALSDALDRIGDDLAMETHNDRADALLVSLVGSDTPRIAPAARRELLEHYIGFAVWDVLTFSVTNWRDLDEFDEIRVDRLSPDDAQVLRRGGATATLKGIQFYHFGAFFSLSYRQNDYLWGRLHAAERLIDIVLDAARIEGAAEGVDALALKKQAFRAILDSESRHLSASLDLIVQLRREVDAIGPAGPAAATARAAE
jgi:patatin-related protein